jgi:hypothetical protein
MVGYPLCRNDMSGSFPVVDKPRFRICKSKSTSGTMYPLLHTLKGASAKQFTATHLRVSIAQLNGDVPHELVLESDGHDSRYCFYYGRFAVCDMSNCACIR